jgi:polar amino acid transport system permease protein
VIGDLALYLGLALAFGAAAYGIGLNTATIAATVICVIAIGLGRRQIPPAAQIAITWALLTLLAFGLFARFDLSLDFIFAHVPQLLGLEAREGFLQGAALSIFISVVSIICASALAFITALMRLAPQPMIRAIAIFYISFFRGTPLLLQALILYLGLPQIGVVIDAIPAGVIALSLCYGAYMAEIFRAGIEAIPKGQREAAQALGLKPWATLRHVVLPQAIVLIIPPTGNQFISMLKDSALVSVMGVWELTFIARTHGRASFKYMEMMIAAGLIYWLLSALFELIQARIEARYGKGVRT